MNEISSPAAEMVLETSGKQIAPARGRRLVEDQRAAGVGVLPGERDSAVFAVRLAPAAQGWAVASALFKPVTVASEQASAPVLRRIRERGHFPGRSGWFTIDYPNFTPRTTSHQQRLHQSEKNSQSATAEFGLGPVPFSSRLTVIPITNFA